MSQIFSIAHQKGGVGKSTLTYNLSLLFSEDLHIGLLDTDLQGSISNIIEEGENLSLIPAETDLQELKKLDFDMILIDTPPYLSQKLPELFAISDFVLVPTKAGFFDIMAIRSTIQLIKEAQILNPRVTAGVVLNMVKRSSNLSNDIKTILEGYGLPILNAKISDRVSYSRSLLLGGVLKTKDGKAKAEILQLADEILNLMGI